MKVELDALTKNHTWDLVTFPPRQSVVCCKWIYKIKTRFDGSIERYKVFGYEETFTSIARILSVHALLAIVATSK